MNPTQAAAPSPSRQDVPWWSPARADICARSHTGLVRENNEDAYILYRIGRWLEPIDSNLDAERLPPRSEDTAHLMLLADGVGGHRAGEVASQSALATAMELIQRAPRWALRFDDPATRDTEIREMVERGHRYIAGVQETLRRRIESDPTLEGMATTMTSSYLVGRDLFVMHVGDSKAFVVRRGTLHRITRDHTLAQEYADQGLIPQEEVPRHRFHNVLTRAVGSADAITADFHHVVLEREDRVLICSDGLTDMATEEEILATMAVHSTSVKACEALVALALAHGGRDNVTVIVAGRT
jgi:serine/threonine protein phosphatase PrpC